MIIGVELVTDRTTKAPAEKEIIRVVEMAKDNGVSIVKGSVLGNMLRINPPLCIQKEDVCLVADVLDHAFEQC